MKKQYGCRISSLCSFVVVMFACLIATIGWVHAEEKIEEVNLQSTADFAEKNGKTYKIINKDIKNINNLTVITLTTDNPDVAGVRYIEKNVNEEYTEYSVKFADSVMFTGEQMKYLDSKMTEEQGIWVDEISLYAKRKGTGNITLTIENAGVITTKVYHIVVKGTAPKFAKKLTVDTMFLNEKTELYIKNVSKYAKLSMSCNKEKAVRLDYSSESNSFKVKLGKQKKLLSVSDLDEYNDVEYTIIPLKPGNLKIKINIEQDGKVYNKVYNLNGVKYKNPFKSLKIAGKEYAQYFNHHHTITDVKKMPYSKRISRKACEQTQGGKSFKIKMNRGYKLKSMTYRHLGDWDNVGDCMKLSNSATKLPKEFGTLSITYKDRKGRTWTNTFFYSGVEW